MKELLLAIIVVAVVCEYKFLTANALYRSTFETEEFPQSNSRLEIQNDGELTREKNPSKDVINNSEYVCRSRVKVDSATKSRAEYSSGRMSPTDQRTFIFTFKGYFPLDFMTYDDHWMCINQQKTWPCGRHDGYDTQICYGGGIFNDFHLFDRSTITMRYRADPDCFVYEAKRPEERWFHYVHEIFFTNDQTGWYKTWWNGVLVDQNSNIKTLMDDFPSDDSCDLYYSVGVYSMAKVTIAGEFETMYIDDIAIFDGKEVQPSELMNTTLYNSIKCNGKSNAEQACGNPFNGICVEDNVCECYENTSGANCEFGCPYCSDMKYCSSGNCVCRQGWTGDTCSTPICESMPSNAKCIAPNIWICTDGKIGPECKIEQGNCSSCGENQYCDTNNNCQCQQGFSGKDCSTPICSDNFSCGKNQYCSSPNTCLCVSGYIGENCTVRDCLENFAGENCDECLYGYGGKNCKSLIVSLDSTIILIGTIASIFIIIFIIFFLINLLLLCLLSCSFKNNLQENKIKETEL